MNHLKHFIYSFSVFIASLALICWIVSLAQLEEQEKQQLVTNLIKIVK